MQRHLDRSRRILVVDDSPTDAARVYKLLSPDYDVEVIHDSAAALERLASGNIPDLLLLDWVMPGISGIEVCRYARSKGGRLLHVPILLLTARHGPEEITQAFNNGANDYVAKPFVDEELQARVAALLFTRSLLERTEQAEADVRALLSNAPDATFAVDAQGIVTFVNDEATRVLQASEKEVLGRPLSELVPGVALRYLGLQAGESFLPVPDVQIGKRIFNLSIRTLPSDSAARTTVALHDVTSRRRAETKRLDFYNIIAHDLRMPITSSALRIQMALQGRHGIMNPALTTDLRKVDQSLRSLLALINDFLDLASLEGVGYKIERQPVDLGALVRETVEDLRPLLDKNELTWVEEGLDTNALIMGDRQRLMQVLSNLIGNAIKFTPAPGRITTSLFISSESVEVSIADTGRGIAAADLPTIFDRFTRAHESIKELTGTGLGLMIVKEIIEAHDGKIGVESSVGKGSRFWFRLGLCSADSKPPPVGQ